MRIIQPLIESIKNARSLAKNGIYLDQFGVRRDQLADTGPVEFKRGQNDLLLIVGKDALLDTTQSIAMDGRQMRLRIKVDHKCRMVCAMHGCGKIEYGSCFTDATFLIEHCDTHRFTLYRA